MFYDLDFILLSLYYETTKLWRYVKTDGRCYEYPIYDEMKEYGLCKEEWDGEIQDFLFCHVDEDLDPQEQYHLDDMYICRNRALSLYECGDSY